MWAALANCFDKMDKPEEAIKCTKWVERVKDKEAFAMHKLAKLHLQQGDEPKAVQYFLENL
jgi:anaphase-promoting complex subunit 8